jgi:acyl-homoserine lactone acylase PvdQ
VGRRVLFIAALVAALVVPAAASAKDYSGTALNIIPSGQQGGVPPAADADRQAKMYDGLTPLFGSVSTRDLFRYFKSEKLGTAGQGPLTTERPKAGLRIVRDGFHVPHIYGRTQDLVTYGAGWALAEDRGLLLEQARYNARVAAVDAPGLDALTLVAGLKTFEPSPQTEAEVAKQSAVLRAAGRKGRAVLHDIDQYVAGINGFYKKHNNPAKPWTRSDIYALNALKGQFVGEGGGDEARRSAFLSGLQSRLGGGKGISVFNDLRERDDPETPVSVDGRVTYPSPTERRRGNVVLDAGSIQRTTVQALAARQAAKAHASNALLVSAKRSRTGHPLMVAGPQIGYFYPGLTLEMDLHGPGYEARGATSAPFPGYMLIGRGQDYAWSLTSAGLDIIDTYVETLCDNSDVKYMYKGQCRSMAFFDAGKLKGTPDREVTFYRTVHGPVIGYATVNGRRVALTRKRASYGRDSLDQLLYRDLTLNKVKNVRQFLRAANQTPQTFNSFYLDDRDIGVFTSGRVPIRPSGTDPSLPIDGTGSYEWKGYMSFKQHPQGVNPRNGQIVNWNNKLARGFQSGDDNWSLGAEHRVQLLTGNLGGGKESLASVTSAMNKAATQDLRAMRTLPVLAAVLDGGPAPTPREAQMLQLLESWRTAGGSRLDRDGDGRIDNPGAAIIDRAWPKLADAWAGPVLGPQVNELATLEGRYNQPPGGQNFGWHVYMDKDLRSLLGRRVRGPFANRYCGGGNLVACRASLWAAMKAAGDELAAEQGPDPTGWHSDAVRERIEFVPGLLPYTMRYTNRPTGIQQVITFTGHRRARK